MAGNLRYRRLSEHRLPLVVGSAAWFDGRHRSIAALLTWLKKHRVCRAPAYGIGDQEAYNSSRKGGR